MITSRDRLCEPGLNVNHYRLPGLDQSAWQQFFMQILGQTYVNLGDFYQANQILHQALTFAEESHYMQVKAKTLNGLAEIHRQQGESYTFRRSLNLY